MRKIAGSANTAPTSSLIARADARSRPIGFSSTTRAVRRLRRQAASSRQIGPNRSGAVAR